MHPKALYAKLFCLPRAGYGRDNAMDAPENSHSRSPCRSCGMRHSTMCAALSPAQLQRLEQFKPADRLVRAGEHVFAEGETPGHVHTMKSGWVMLYSLLADGRRHIHEFCVRGALLSFGMEPDQPAPYSAQALTDAMICALPRPEISDMLREIPDMAMSLACLAARGQTRAFRQSVDVGHRSARERVAGLLLDLVD
ncbi:MAG: Crp/Fnr family transcriptional regulator, partial [Proteobacteria bacterium]|nr:Crp/Fnr family transcriptional regulator [Pseudomonadota bacterium]